MFARIVFVRSRHFAIALCLYRQFRAVRSADDLQTALNEIGYPAVIKTASSGYDGKGQAVIRHSDDSLAVWNSLCTDAAILEQFIEFECEISVIGSRNPQGETTFYRPFQNAHANHILDVTICPALVDQRVEKNAIEIARSVF